MPDRWLREPSDPAAPDQHHCEPLSPPVYPEEEVGSHLDRWNRHPCIGWEPAATTCDLPTLEAVIRTTPVETGADLYHYLLNIRETEPVKSRGSFEGHRRFLDALLSDLIRHPKVAAIVNEWETETMTRRDERLRRALAALREDAKENGEASVEMQADRPLPSPGGTL